MADEKISQLTAKATPVDADVTVIVDSVGGTNMKLSWASIKATLLAYLNGIYQALLNPGLANLAYSGFAFTATAGDNLAIGDVCYLNADGTYHLAKADVATTKLPGVVIATETILSGNPGVFLQKGFLRDDSWSAWTVGGALYVSITGTTGNTVTQTAPSASGNIVQDIGYAYAANILFFDPNRTSVEVA